MAEKISKLKVKVTANIDELQILISNLQMKAVELADIINDINDFELKVSVDAVD